MKRPPFIRGSFNTLNDKKKEIRMEKRMEAITVRTEGRMVYISNDDYGDGKMEVGIPVDQLDTIMGWLQEARVELED